MQRETASGPSERRQGRDDRISCSSGQERLFVFVVYVFTFLPRRGPMFFYAVADEGDFNAARPREGHVHLPVIRPPLSLGLAAIVALRDATSPRAVRACATLFDAPLAALVCRCCRAGTARSQIARTRALGAGRAAATPGCALRAQLPHAAGASGLRTARTPIDPASRSAPVGILGARRARRACSGRSRARGDACALRGRGRSPRARRRRPAGRPPIDRGRAAPGPPRRRSRPARRSPRRAPPRSR